jgi:transcriptional regulator with XRE-family HTH domain/tetratricopeptide (TPR) repeat protein
MKLDDASITNQDAVSPLTVGAKLRHARGKKITLTKLALELNYSKGYLSRIEHDDSPATKEVIEGYGKILKLSADELRELEASLMVGPKGGQVVWHVPYRHNPFFTGRRIVLEQLRNGLTDGENTPHVVAIVGLGGIGKTQLAVEYAWRNRKTYQTVIWLEAGTFNALTTSCVNIVNDFDLPERNAQDQSKTVAAFQRWLSRQSRFLIILDNVNHREDITDFLLKVGDNDILITTRSREIGNVAQVIELGEMTLEESMQLLLHRAYSLSLSKEHSEDILAEARVLSRVLGGLPLALSQAGSYIEQTGCTLHEYLELFKEQQLRIFNEKGALPVDYSETVATTWSLSFEQIRQSNPVAEELLYLCAFLNSNGIHEGFILDGVAALGPVLQEGIASQLKLRRLIGELRKYSLIQTDIRNNIIFVHPLVQLAIRETLDKETQRVWVKRTIAVANSAFPLVKVATWQQTWSKCQRYFPQVEVCLVLADQWEISNDDVVQLFYKAGRYLEARTQISDAEIYYKRAIILNELLYGKEHKTTPWYLSSLADLYRQQERYSEAESLYREALSIQKRIAGLGPTNIELLTNYVTLLLDPNRSQEVVGLNLYIENQQVDGWITKRIVVNDSDEDLIHYSKGDWLAVPQPDSFKGDGHITQSKNASFEYSFVGTGIEIISNTVSIHGEIEIYLDSVYEQTINTARIRDRLTQTIIFSRTGLENGVHELKGVIVEGGFILDALAIFVRERSILSTDLP